MNNIEFTVPHLRENTSIETSVDVSDEIISDVIRARMKTIRQLTMSTKFNSRVSLQQLPDILPQYGAALLMQSQEVWLPVDGYFFISDSIVKACVTHKSGNPQSKRNSSVFWAMRKDVVKKRWDISPLSATNKQKFQFWDYDFVKAMLVSIQIDALSETKLHSKISYGLSEQNNLDNLITIRHQVHSEFATMILGSRSKKYEEIAKRYIPS